MTAEFVAAPVPRPLARLQGTIEELLDDPRLDVHEKSWVQATLTDDAPPGRRRWSGCAAGSRTRWCSPSRRPSRPTAAVPARARPAGRSDHEIALDFVRDMRGAAASDGESALLQTACDACAEDPDADRVLTEGLW